MRPQLESLESRTVPSAATLQLVQNPGSSPVFRFTPEGSTTEVEIQPFDVQFTGNLAVALGDFTGDGIEDVAVAPESGGGSHVRVFDGQTGKSVQEFMVFSPLFTGGVSLAAGDLNGDVVVDLIVGAGPGGGPHVRGYDVVSGEILFDSFVFAPEFTGGVSLAVADINGDEFCEIIVGAGPGGGPHVRVLDAQTGASLREFFSFAQEFTGGVNLAAGVGLTMQDSFLAVGAKTGGGPHVRGFNLETGEAIFSFMADDPGQRNGVRLIIANNLNGPALLVENSSGWNQYSSMGALLGSAIGSENGALPLSFADNTRWDWLEGTRWFVPIGDMKSIFFTSQGITLPAADQTLWQITECNQGVFSGFCEVIISSTGFQPLGFSFNGHVTANGVWQMRFLPLAGNETSPEITTIGWGQMRYINNQWAVEMQMISPGGSGFLTHWAYMLEYRDGFNPPNPAQVPDLGDYRSEEFRWLKGTTWEISYKNLLTKEETQDTLVIEDFTNGYFWGNSTGPESYFFLGSVTPEGRVLWANFRNSGEIEELLGRILLPQEKSQMSFRPTQGSPVAAHAELIS